MEHKAYDEKGDNASGWESTLGMSQECSLARIPPPVSASAVTASLKSCSMMQMKNSERRLSPSQSVVDFNRIEVPDSFQSSCLDLLKCHNCPRIMYPPIYSCRKSGHAFCRLCVHGKSSKWCRICKSRFSKTRNHYLESMASLLRLRCSYTLCEDMISGHEIDLHKTICHYRPINCFETELKKCRGHPINFEDYGTHLQEIHKCQVDELKTADFTCLSLSFNNLMRKEHWNISLLDPSLCLSEIEVTFLDSFSSFYTADVGKFSTRILKLDQQLFIFRVRKYSGTEISFAVSILGGEFEATKYHCVTQLQKPKGFTSLQWESPVYSVHMPLDSIHSKGDLLVLSEKMVEPFCSYSGTEAAILGGVAGKFQKQQLTIGVRIGFGTPHCHP